MDWITRSQAEGWKRIAFIGASKHAGKTTGMNAFIQAAAAKNKTLGLCSIGLDGEQLDTILGVAKPPVFVPAGTLLASAEAALEISEARFEYLADTGVTSPLGQILLVRAETAGKVVLAGVRQRRHVARILPMLEEAGAQLCAVDGAFDRVAAAAPELVDAVVLSIGAVLGKTPAAAAAAARPFLLRFQLPTATEQLKANVRPAFDAGAIGVLSGPKLIQFPRHQGVLGLTRHSEWPGIVTAVWTPGAVTDEVLANLLAQPRGVELIAAHPAQITASGETLQRWFSRGHSLSVWRQVPVFAITINPHSITGYDISREALQHAVAELSPGVPVIDVTDDETADEAMEGLR